MEASWSWRPACKPRRGTVRSKEMEDDRTEKKTPSHEARLRTEVFQLVIAAEGSRFLLVFFSICSVYFLVFGSIHIPNMQKSQGWRQPGLGLYAMSSLVYFYGFRPTLRPSIRHSVCKSDGPTAGLASLPGCLPCQFRLWAFGLVALCSFWHDVL